MKKRLKKSNKAIYIVSIIGAMLLICLVLVFLKYKQYKEEINENILEMDTLVKQVTIDTKSEDEKGTESEVANEEPCLMHDFDTLKQMNGDVYAWITIPETKVDYPILQSTTDDKYLNTNIDGSSGYPGCIYSNVCNSKEFDDYITVLYGHNMKSGEMFGSLHNFDDADFFQAFDKYTVETEKNRFIYSIYAVVNYNDKLIPAYFDVKSSTGRDDFIESLEACRENSITHFNDEIEISGEDKVLVLSVCISGQENRRYLVVSKLEEVISYSKE